MTTNKIVETVKDAVAEAKSKVELVGAHGKDVIQTGAQTLQAAREVVADGGREAAQVLTNTRQELQRTLKEGATQIGDQLSRIATPTHKEEATSRKAAVKEKKQRKRSRQAEASGHAAR
ncbi:hypothetical protein D0B54_15400 [Solimonas sp. K1W22B-7]|uniref:hypothetical protein n=1 Tax=Solimonas sp. K1W22B-7 TaxID=2303331 RepID=UPI000E3377D4|nr:hypothetical protein [Solimonas sp. K1W22B-7]AXQ29976.1 hypothetical protein D0B54_15400 [Solimonas sp. K1W22B-7]